MEARLISLPLVQTARLAGLVRQIEPVKLEANQEWGLLIRGRGFARLLERELLHAPNLIRPVSWSTPRPITFRSKVAAAHYIQRIGLRPTKSTWRVTEER